MKQYITLNDLTRLPYTLGQRAANKLAISAVQNFYGTEIITIRSRQAVRILLLVYNLRDDSLLNISYFSDEAWFH